MRFIAGEKNEEIDGGHREKERYLPHPHSVNRLDYAVEQEGVCFNESTGRGQQLVACV